jgi:hypothetical protein
VSASVGLAVLLYGVIVENRPAATIVTSLTSYKDGNYSGRQEQFYSFPFLMFDRGVLRLEYSTRNDRGSGPPSTYSGYAVTSTDQFAALSPQSKLEVSFPKYRQLQCVCVATLENTMDVPKNDDAWYEPKG